MCQTRMDAWQACFGKFPIDDGIWQTMKKVGIVRISSQLRRCGYWISLYVMMSIFKRFDNGLEDNVGRITSDKIEVVE